MNRILCAAPAEGQEEETKRASRDPMHRCEVRRIQGDIIRGARDTSQKEAEATALRFKKEDHRKQISRNRKQISRNRKQKGVIIQGQIPERSWQNPAVLGSYRDGSRILGACGARILNFQKLVGRDYKTQPQPVRSHVAVQNRSTMRLLNSEAGGPVVLMCYSNASGLWQSCLIIKQRRAARAPKTSLAPRRRSRGRRRPRPAAAAAGGRRRPRQAG